MNGSFGWQLIPFPDSSYSQRVDSGHPFVADRPIRRFVRHSGIPDVVPMDISRPRLGGVEATRTIRQEAPESEVTTIQNDPAIVRR